MATTLEPPSWSMMLAFSMSHYSHAVNYKSTTTRELPNFTRRDEFGAMVKALKMPSEMLPEGVSKRLAALWRSTGIATKKEFAENAGLTANRFENYLARGALGLDGAVSLSTVYGVTLDYIYLGDIRGVPVERAAKLRTAMVEVEHLGVAALTDAAPKRRGRPPKAKELARQA